MTLINTSWPSYRVYITSTYTSGIVYTSSRLISSRLRRHRNVGLKGSAKVINGYRMPTPFRAFDVQYHSTATSKTVNPHIVGVRYQEIQAQFTDGGYVSPARYRMSLVRANDYRPQVSQNTKNRAVTQCLAKANRNSIELGVAIGESRQALSMVRSRTIKVLDALRLARRGNFRELYRKYGAGAIRRSSGIWLEYQMGWKPLINDVSDAIDLWNRGMDRRHIVTAKSFARDTLSRPPLPNMALGFQFEGEESSFCRLDYEVSNQDLQGLKQIGLFNPLSVAWELIPYSFLVDYVVPIGTFISAASGTFGLNLLSSSRTDRIEWTATWTGGDGSGTLLGGTRSVGRQSAKCVERVVGFTPAPTLYYNPFGLSSSTRQLNIAALLTQRSL